MKTKTTSYPGIDYSRGTSNTDSSNGIRYGVISQHSVNPEALDDIMTHGEDVAWVEALAEAVAEKTTQMESEAHERGEDFDPSDVDEDRIADDLGMNWESSFNNYVYNQNGYKLTGCGDSDLFVIKSPFFTYAQFCSPCVPGAGNLDTVFESGTNQAGLDGTDYAKEATEAGFPRVYCLGHDWFDDGAAPYAVFSVETGKAIVAGEKN